MKTKIWKIKKIVKLIKIEKNGDLQKIYKIYKIYYNLLIAQDLWEAYYQILSIIFLKEFIELDVNLVTMIKNVRLEELSISIATVSLNLL